MNILKNLFGGNGKTDTNNQGIEFPVNPVSEITQPVIDEKTFIDTEPPQSENIEGAKSNSSIKDMLSRNYESKGINDGYEFGTQEIHDIQISKIKSEFRLNIDQMIEEKRSALVQLKTRKVEIGVLSETLSKQLDIIVEETQNSLNELLKEKQYSEETKGWVMDIVNAYSLGFKRGLHSKEEERLLMNPFSNFQIFKN